MPISFVRKNTPFFFAPQRRTPSGDDPSCLRTSVLRAPLALERSAPAVIAGRAGEGPRGFPSPTRPKSGLPILPHSMYRLRRHIPFVQDQARIHVPAGPLDPHPAVPVGDPPPDFRLVPLPFALAAEVSGAEQGSAPSGTEPCSTGKGKNPNDSLYTHRQIRSWPRPH